MRAFTFRFVVQRSTTEPKIATAETTAKLFNLYHTRIDVINTVASPDSMDITIYTDHTVHPAGGYSKNPRRRSSTFENLQPKIWGI